jgi:hypothetical protein
MQSTLGNQYKKPIDFFIIPDLISDRKVITGKLLSNDPGHQVSLH